jgi:hypothetical protein
MRHGETKLIVFAQKQDFPFNLNRRIERVGEQEELLQQQPQKVVRQRSSGVLRQGGCFKGELVSGVATFQVTQGSL